jgi:hypothetical protein
MTSKSAFVSETESGQRPLAAGVEVVHAKCDSCKPETFEAVSQYDELHVFV